MFTSPTSHCRPSRGAGTLPQLCGVEMRISQGEGPGVGPLGALWVSARPGVCFLCALDKSLPSLNFHSLSIEWNSSATLLRRMRVR